MQSDARYRFERGIDSESINWGVDVASNMILDIKELESSLAGRTPNQVRSLLSSILPEYQPDLDSKEPVFLRLKAEA